MSLNLSQSPESETDSFVDFVTESVLLCIDKLQQMNIINVFDRKESENTYEKLAMAKEMTDAIIKVIENYRLTEVEEFYSCEESTFDDDVTMFEEIRPLQNYCVNGNLSSSLPVHEDQESSQTSSKK